MKKLLQLIFAVLLVCQFSFAQSPSTFINEINYLASHPDDRIVEIAGEAGQDLAGWSLVYYFADGTINAIEEIQSGVIPNDQNDFGVIIYDIDQGGGSGGLALVNASDQVVQFISYGLTPVIEALEGPAAGQTPEFIGSQLLPFNSLQLFGSGNEYEDFSWTNLLLASPGSINVRQLIEGLLGNLGLNLFGLQEQNSSAQDDLRVETVQVYPNPFVERVRVTLPNAEINKISVMDASGRFIRTVSSNYQSQVDIHMGDLSPGIYYLVCETGNAVSTHRILKR